MMFGLGSFNLINDFERASKEPNAEQLGSVTALYLGIILINFMYYLGSGTYDIKVVHTFY